MTSEDISKSALRAAFTQTKSLPGVLSRPAKIMGGHGTITLVGGGEDIMEQCWDLAQTCEELWSRFIPESDISRLNWAEGQPVEVAPLTRQLIASMIAGHTLTRGAYDPTLLPDVLAAGYQASVLDPTKTSSLPSTAQAPGHLEGIVFSDNTVALPLGTTLDPGGIGKGCAADVIADFALEKGAFGVMVELGGDIVVKGDAPDGTAWILGVEDPIDEDSHVSIVRLQAGAIATSSQLKKRFRDDQHHLINPATHRSATSAAQTVSVIAATGARAEVLTKRGFVDDEKTFLDWLPTVGAAGLIVRADRTIRTSANWSVYA
ncbi:hypothetical protein AINA4_00300 [Aurantimicrobium sp. INA4]|uniref:FAD:protein FMN transferase n=1 Tax=Aurantimicrobium sp. INA4 TaxID=2986279 RepID=UPI002490F315|nr:FAD:protein FMN transferase [Aurantimicrobium sp. INA4]BDU10109.1 hypothetical protein AINA4_00300 [Aurantimicrobium sp. INA4]